MADPGGVDLQRVGRTTLALLTPRQESPTGDLEPQRHQAVLRPMPRRREDRREGLRTSELDLQRALREEDVLHATTAIGKVPRGANHHQQQLHSYCLRSRGRSPGLPVVESDKHYCARTVR